MAPKSGQLLIATALGLGAGLALGWVFFSRPSPPTTEAPISNAAAMRAASLVPASAPRQRAAPAADEAVLCPREAVLDARVRMLENEAEKRRIIPKRAELEPLVPPPELPARFAQNALFAAVTAGLKEIDAGVEISNIDCTEYPCIVYAGGMSDEGRGALRHSAALQPYSGDFGFVAGSNQLTALALVPADEGDREELARRLALRMTEMSLSTPSGRVGATADP